MDKALSNFALARKAGRLELGEEPAGIAARAGRAYLMVVAENAGDHTWRRAKSFVAGTTQIAVKVPYTKEALGLIVGRGILAIAAFTDPAMAAGFLKAIPNQEAYTQELEALLARSQRMYKRQQEAKAHDRNKRFGKAGAGAKKH